MMFTTEARRAQSNANGTLMTQIGQMNADKINSVSSVSLW